MALPPTVTDSDQRPLPPNPECTRCGLADTSETVCCPSRGPKHAPIMFFGEAPGAEEERLERPFVGDSGRKLNYCLSGAELPRKSIRIGNVVRCRPPRNRVPSKKEQQACWPYTLAEILRVQPKIIVALGATAWRALLPHHAKHRLDKWRGFPEKFEYRYTTPKGKEFSHSCWVVGTLHPLACLRNWELDDLLIRDLKLAAQYAAGNEFMVTPDTRVHTCQTVADVKDLVKRLLRRGSAVVDTEATGTDPHTCKLRCIGFCMRSGESWIIPWMDENGDQFWTREDQSILIRVLTRLFRKLKIVGQGLKFDIQIFRKLLGIIDYLVEFDTMCGAHVLDENKPTNLTFLCQWHLHWHKYDAVIEQFGSGSDLADAYAAAPSAVLHQYCGYDCDGTFRLWKKFEPEIKKQGLKIPFSIELGLVLPLADVEFRGLHLDRAKLQEAADGYRTALRDTRASLIKTCKRVFRKRDVAVYCKRCGVKDFVPAEFNPNSADQVAPLLLAAGAELKKKTPGGKFATDKLVLSFLALHKGTAGSIARRLRLMRALTKWKSTYFDGNDEDKTKNGFLGLIAEHDRVHASYFITAARTGRLSAKDPPLQTVPRVDPALALGYPVKDQVSSLVKPRMVFVPDVPGEHVLLEVDYSKVELCCAAWVSGDAVMVPELLPGAPRDLHTNMAITTRLMRDPTDHEYKSLMAEISKSERTVAKCFHPNTEVLTRTGWRRILDLKDGDEVAQAVPGMRGEVVFQWVRPIEVFSMPNEFDHLLHFENEGIDLLVTPDHGMIFWNGGASRDPWIRLEAREFAHKEVRYWANAGFLQDGKMSTVGRRLKGITVRLAVVTQADGSYQGNQIRFGFTKKAKIRRMRKLLEQVRSDHWYEGMTGGVTTFVIQSSLANRIKALLDGKSFPWRWLGFTEARREVVLDEASYWDSCRAATTERYTYSNTDQQSIDVLQAIATLTGRKTRKVFAGRKESHHGHRWTLSVKDHAYTRGGNLSVKLVPYTGTVACLTVPSHAVVVRRGGLSKVQIPVVTSQSVNFGVIYGRTARNIAESNPGSFPFDMPLRTRTAKVQKVIDAWLEKYQGVALWRDEQIATIRRKGYLRDWLGRRRLLTGIRWFQSRWAEDCQHTDEDNGHMENQAMNFGIQALATGLHNRATRKCYEGIKQVRIPALRIVMTLHDALFFNVHRDYVDDAIHHIKGWMELTLPAQKREGRPYEMPLTVDAVPCDYWGQHD